MKKVKNMTYPLLAAFYEILRYLKGFFIGILKLIAIIFIIIAVAFEMPNMKARFEKILEFFGGVCEDER